MKKLLVLIMAFAMMLSVVGCGGNEADTPSEPAQSESTEFTPEQQALAEDFTKMVDEFNAIADKVNANPELLSDEELVSSMNELSKQITELDQVFTSPENLTPEVMGAMRVAVDVGRSFIAEASAALDEVEQ